MRLAAYPNVAAKETAPVRLASVAAGPETRGQPSRHTIKVGRWVALRRDDDVLERKVSHDQQAQQDHDYHGPPD